MNRLYMSAHSLNEQNILSLVAPNPEARFLDLGCSDGTWTKVVAEKLGTRRVFGMEVVKDRVSQAREKGIEVRESDIGSAWPFEDSCMDVIHNNFVIEHLSDVDLFAREIHRVLSPGGYFITATENGSSWHNIIAAVLGWQPFSSTCMSTTRLGIGNPMALHRGKPNIHPSERHKVIFHYRGLLEFFGAHDFTDFSIRGAGYYPLPSFFGQVDPRHSHFIALKGRKRA